MAKNHRHLHIKMCGSSPYDELQSTLRRCDEAIEFAKVTGQAVWNEYPDLGKAIATYSSKYPDSLDDLEEQIG